MIFFYCRSDTFFVLIVTDYYFFIVERDSHLLRQYNCCLKAYYFNTCYCVNFALDIEYSQNLDEKY